MKYEETTYKLAAYIHTLEKIEARRAQYMTDAEKVTQELSIYSDEYKKAHETDARGRLNTAFITDMLGFRDAVDKLNADLLAAFASDTKPKADTSAAVYFCMQYISIRKEKADKKYFEQLATPIREADDIQGLREVVQFFAEKTKANNIPFGNVIAECTQYDDYLMKLNLLGEKTLAALPAPGIDVASLAQAEPFSRFGQVSGLLEFTKKTKAEINGEDYTPQAVGAFGDFNFRKVRGDGATPFASKAFGPTEFKPVR